MAISAQLPYFKSINITGEKYQSYGTVAQTPWALKAAIGLLSDTVPFFGYHKRSYILLVSVLGTISVALLGLVQLSAATASIGAILLLLTNLQLAAVDLLCEGKYAEMMVAKPESGSDLVTYVWALYMTGTFLGSLIVGPMADRVNPRYIFLVCLPLAAQVIFPTAAGWLPDRQLPPGERGVRMDKIRTHPDLFKLSIAMTVGASAVGAVALVGSGAMQSIISTIAAILLCIMGSMWLPPMLARANLYMFLSNMLYVSLPGALDYWFTGNPECVPNGPHFSNTYYITYASLVGSLAGGLGVACFQRFLSRGRFRTAFWTTCVVKLAASFFDIAIVKRYNMRFGVPDKVAFMLGDAVIFQVAYTLDFMPAVVLTSKVCPKGMESSVYALLASYQNLGSNMARTLGVALIHMLGINTVKTDTKPCDFTNLPLAIFIGHILLPLLVFPLVFILIPNAKMTDNLLPEDDEEKRGEFSPVPTEEPKDGESQDGSSQEITDEILPAEKSGKKETTQIRPLEKSEAIPVVDDSCETGGKTDQYSPDIARSDDPSVLSITPGALITGIDPDDEVADLLPSSAIEQEDSHIEQTSEAVGALDRHPKS